VVRKGGALLDETGSKISAKTNKHPEGNAGKNGKKKKKKIRTFTNGNVRGYEGSTHLRRRKGGGAGERKVLKDRADARKQKPVTRQFSVPGGGFKETNALEAKWETSQRGQRGPTTVGKGRAALTKSKELLSSKKKKKNVNL